MATALIIGLGTSGLHIIEECQQFHYQFTGKNKPDSVEYLYLETDKNATPRATAMGKSDIDRVFITLKDIAASTSTLLNNKSLDHSWIPPVDAAMAAEDGAGGQSSYGRMALWFHFSEVKNAILSKWQSIHGDNNTYVFIVGTLTGGTCSGSCVDMAYLVRDVTKSNNVFGLLLAPSRQQLSVSGADALFYNYYSTIASINHYSNAENAFDCTYPDGTHIHNNVAPFKVCYFLSQDYTNMFAPIKSVADLYSVAGLHVFSRIHSMGEVDNAGQQKPTFTATIDRRCIDIMGQVPEYRFATFGSKLVFYPKELLKELFGVSLAKAELERWVDTQNYVDAKGSRIAIQGQKNNIAEAIKKDFETAIVNSLNSIDSVSFNGDTLEKAFMNEVDTLLNKKYSEPSPRAFLFNLLSIDNSSSYMTMVASNDKAIMDNLIDAIHNTLVKRLDEFKNLSIGKLTLETIAQAMEDLLKFWQKEYKITGDDAQWNQFIQRHIANVLDKNKLPQILLQNKAYFQEQLRNLLMLAKMHVAQKVLTRLSDELRTKKSSALRGSNGTTVLPTIPRIQEVVNLVLAVINNSDGTSNITLTRRDNEIRNTLSTDVNNFTAIFANGSLDQDLKSLETEYANNVKSKNPYDCKVITTNKSLWEYLDKVTKQVLYSDCIVNSTTYVQTHLKSLQGTTINGIISSISQTPNDAQWISIRDFITGNEDQVRQKLPGQIELINSKYLFQNHNCLKLIYLNGDLNTLQSQMGNYSVTPNNDHACELDGMNDAIIVYQEYGFMGGNVPPFNPVLHIGINPTIRKKIVDNIDYEHDSAALPATFVFKRRVPYLSQKQFADILNIEL